MKRTHTTIVVPANAGTQYRADKKTLGSRVRGNDGVVGEAMMHFRNSQ
jgi:hypothetical protein